MIAPCNKWYDSSDDNDNDNDKRENRRNGFMQIMKA